MSAVDWARWRAWGMVADTLGLRVTFRPIHDGWSASARGHRAEGATGTDALAALCRKVAVNR